MTTQEKLADDLGQIAFRLETNWGGIKNRCLPKGDTPLREQNEIEADIDRDIERLKSIKVRLLDISHQT